MRRANRSRSPLERRSIAVFGPPTLEGDWALADGTDEANGADSDADTAERDADRYGTS